MLVIVSVVLWAIDGQETYALGVSILTCIAVAVSVWFTHRTNRRIHQMAYYEVELDVLRGGEVRPICSREVVPGDIVFFKSPMKIPFDCILLEGSCLVNESSLTGELIPVPKKQEDLN